MRLSKRNHRGGRRSAPSSRATPHFTHPLTDSSTHFFVSFVIFVAQKPARGGETPRQRRRNPWLRKIFSRCFDASRNSISANIIKGWVASAAFPSTNCPICVHSADLIVYAHQPARLGLSGAGPHPKGWGLSIATRIFNARTCNCIHRWMPASRHCAIWLSRRPIYPPPCGMEFGLEGLEGWVFYYRRVAE